MVSKAKHDETFGQRFKRILVQADLRPDDHIPLFGDGSVENSYTYPTVKELDYAAGITKIMLYLWLSFVIAMMLGFSLLWVFAFLNPTVFHFVNIWALILFLLIEIFVLIQGLSVVGYIRWRLKRQKKMQRVFEARRSHKKD